MTEQLMELADRCEKATGPSYALDCEIWDAIYPGERDARFEKLTSEGPYKGRLGPADRDGYVQPLRAFSASLDAAMGLVPSDWRVADVGETVVECADPWMVKLFQRAKHDREAQRVRGDAATFQLALTAAALRARAQSENLGGGDE